MILLLGGGYTLRRVANLLPTGSFVITSRSSQSISEFKAHGWYAEIVKSEEPESLKNLFLKYPSILQIVDSIPPISYLGGDSALSGIENLCRLMPQSKVKRFIYLSTTGVFGREDGSWVNEETQPMPNNQKSKLRLDSEMMYRSYIPNVCAFRIAAIYGPGRGIGNSIKNGTYRLIENYDRWSNRIQVDDLAQAIANALNLNIESPYPPVVCLSDDQPSLTSEVVSFYCNQFNLPKPSSVERSEVEKRQAWTLLSNQRVSNKLLRDTFLPDIRYPTYKEGAKTEFMSQIL